MNAHTQLLVTDVVFREDLYPRIDKSPETVQKYAEDLSVLPPIEVNQHNELIDGWHRWTAHRTVKAEKISVVVVETTSDTHLLELAIESNAKHGLQLSQADKQDMAHRIYNATPVADRDAKKAQLATLLSVSERTVRGWLSRIDKDSKAARDRRIFDRWLACWTQQEIADAEGMPQQSVAASCTEFGNAANLGKTAQAAAEHATDFEPPIYNVWKQQTKSSGSSHFGNSESRWVDNLLYMYTSPLDIVVDPFAGGGSTIDVCKKRLRRYFVSDRAPIVAREEEIRRHDMTAGLPPLNKQAWKDVSLVYLDPPYWIQAAGQYSEDAEDLANMELGAFSDCLAGVIGDFMKKLNAAKRAKPAYVAMILQPTQWKAPERAYTDHVADMIRRVKAPIHMRISAPYESQQCNAQMVEWAKDNRQVLVLSREIVVWRTDD